MQAKRKLHPSPAMIVACLALFIALGGASYAAVKLKAGSVKTKTIKNGAVKTNKIADGAVTSAKLAEGAVGTKKASASGVATNDGVNGASSSVGIGANTCAAFTLNAPGVQPGDAVAFSAGGSPGVPAAIGTVSGDFPTVPTAGKLSIRICSASVPYTVATGALSVSWVAFR